MESYEPYKFINIINNIKQYKSVANLIWSGPVVVVRKSGVVQEARFAGGSPTTLGKTSFLTSPVQNP